jgi:hypothetical protein
MYEKQINTTRREEQAIAESAAESNNPNLSKAWVYPVREGFIVTSYDAKGNKKEYKVTRNLRQILVCCCPDYVKKYLDDPQYLCQHLAAVDSYLFSKLKALENPPEEEVQVKWRCHYRVRRSIEDLMQKIVEHPEGKSLEELRSLIQKKTGDKEAPESLFTESAERIEKWLREFLMNLTAEEVEPDTAA